MWTYVFNSQVYFGVKLLGHIVTLTLEELPNSYHCAVQFYIASSNVCMMVPVSLHTCQHLYCLVFYCSHAYKWHLILVLICISLISSIFSGVYWPFVYIRQKNVYSNPLPIFKLSCLFIAQLWELLGFAQYVFLSCFYVKIISYLLSTVDYPL